MSTESETGINMPTSSADYKKLGGALLEGRLGDLRDASPELPWGYRK
jgi:hypothetical protein